jgi:hypothetical protein
MDSIINVVPQWFVMLLMIGLLMYYPFAVVGMEIFSARGPTHTSRCSAREFISENLDARFCAMPQAYITLFQVSAAARAVRWPPAQPGRCTWLPHRCTHACKCQHPARPPSADRTRRRCRP